MLASSNIYLSLVVYCYRLSNVYLYDPLSMLTCIRRRSAARSLVSRHNRRRSSKSTRRCHIRSGRLPCDLAALVPAPTHTFVVHGTSVHACILGTLNAEQAHGACAVLHKFHQAMAVHEMISRALLHQCRMFCSRCVQRSVACAVCITRGLACTRSVPVRCAVVMHSSSTRCASAKLSSVVVRFQCPLGKTC